jgi:hypothetical protein
MSACLALLLLWVQSLAPQPAAEAALARAAALRAALRETPAAQLESARRQAIEAYRELRRDHPTARELCAEAGYWAGELWRASGNLAEARREWLIAADQPAGIRFRDRARMELAHLDRRAGSPDAALRRYSEIDSDPEARPALREEALHWIGALELARGRPADARRAWQRLAERAEDPVSRVRAFDRIAQAGLDQDDLEAAAGVIDQCRQALSDLAQEETRTGERVRHALATMRALELLPALIEQRRASREAPKRRAGQGG